MALDDKKVSAQNFSRLSKYSFTFSEILRGSQVVNTEAGTRGRPPADGAIVKRGPSVDKNGAGCEFEDGQISDSEENDRGPRLSMTPDQCLHFAHRVRSIPPVSCSISVTFPGHQNRMPCEPPRSPNALNYGLRWWAMRKEPTADGAITKRGPIC